MPVCYWYLVTVCGPSPMHFLVNTETGEKAKEVINVTEKECSIAKVNWNTLKALTGCMIPPKVGGIGFATGPLSFQNSFNVVTVVT